MMGTRRFNPVRWRCDILRRDIVPSRDRRRRRPKPNDAPPLDLNPEGPVAYRPFSWARSPRSRFCLSPS